MKTSALTLIALGIAIGSLLTWLLLGRGDTEATVAPAQPLYWVAPMDPNYRRDQPGKSPMGMDLVPVYADDAASRTPGTVVIPANVMHNLGVRTAQVERGAFEQEIRTVGHVTFDEFQLLHIHPRVEGWIETLRVKAEGDPVVAGEPLFELYSPTLVNAQEELLLALNRNNPALIDAALQRLHALEVPAGAIEQLQRTRTVSQTINVYAPQTGVVQTLAVREGMYVSPGMNVMTIGPLDHVWVVGELYERQALQVSKGDAISLSLDYLPGREWQSTVDYVYPSLNESTRTVRVRAVLQNDDGALKPGMFGELRVRSAQRESPTLLIPREALIRTGTQNRVVLVLADGEFKSVAVQPGRIGRTQAEILSGLEAGDRIVSSAQFLIDSESSRTSDFRRMDSSADSIGHARMDPIQMDNSEMDHSEMDHSQHRMERKP
jgi:Cu(I)/Ag(I) efflux system membrane fusion protein